MAEKKGTSTTKRLYRSHEDRMIAGVAGGLGEYFAIDPILIRIIFVAITLAGGSGVLLYILLWLLIPDEPYHSYSPEETIKHNAKELEQTAKTYAKKLENNWGREHMHTWIGIGLLILGSMFLLRNMGFPIFVDLSKLWPILLVFIGVKMLMKGR